MPKEQALLNYAWLTKLNYKLELILEHMGTRI
jgi:hypothetical protein